MLYTYGLNGEVKCVEDNTSCVLDGENARRGMWVEGTGSGRLILRALTFDKGYASRGGGVYIDYGAIVDLELCIFSNNRATSSTFGGGAIFAEGSGTSVNVYGTSFNGNTALYGGNGHDIYRNDDGSDDDGSDDDGSDDDGSDDDGSDDDGSPTITIHNTCPSPYSSNTPIQGKKRMRIV
jgi:hypothetical protein